MEMVTGQKIDFAINYLTMLPFSCLFSISIDLGIIYF